MWCSFVTSMMPPQTRKAPGAGAREPHPNHHPRRVAAGSRNTVMVDGAANPGAPQAAEADRNPEPFAGAGGDRWE